jgi:hypothetical protein
MVWRSHIVNILDKKKKCDVMQCSSKVPAASFSRAGSGFFRSCGTFVQSKRCHISEDRSLHIYCSENLIF